MSAPVDGRASQEHTPVVERSAGRASEEQPSGATPVKPAIPAAATPAAPAPQRSQSPAAANAVAAAARPAVVATSVGLGKASPTVQLKNIDDSLLKETDAFLQKMKAEPSGGNLTRVTEHVRTNRLYVARCQSALLKATDDFTRKQVEGRIEALNVAYDDASTVSYTRTQESLLSRSPSMMLSGSDTDEDDQWDSGEGKPKKMIAVTFEVRCDHTVEGEKVMIVGDRYELGKWNPLAGVLMETTEETWPVWSATVHLPAGRVCEYKYAIGTKGQWLDQYNVKEWEGHMGNRGFKVGRRRHKVTDEFLTPFRNPDPRPPTFVHMHNFGRTASSECFLDPEYSFLPMD